VKADSRIKADTGLVALRYGPLIYDVETADQPNLEQALSDAPLQMEWRPDLLGGVMAMTCKWQDGTPMLAVPNYARMNRLAQPNDQTAEDASINYGPASAAAAGSNPAAAGDQRRIRTRAIQSKVWITDQT
jgi:hypothetical protein